MDNVDEFGDSFGGIVGRDKGKLGFLQFAGSVSTFITFALAPSAAQTVVLFQLGSVLVVIIGWFWLDEGFLRRRLLGAALIGLGVALAITA